MIVIDLVKLISITVYGWCLGGVSQEYYGGPAVCFFCGVCGLRLKKRLSTEHKIQDSTTR